MGPILVVAGAIIVLIGLLAWAGVLSWFGRLPGDIRVERPNMRIYFPIVSMLLISIVLSVLMMLFRRFK